MVNECESRALPLKNSQLERVRKQYLMLNKSTKDQEDKSNRTDNETESEKPPERRLYDLLFSPVEDLLTKLPKNSPLIVVPDKILHHFPFGLLRDFLNRYAFQRFHLTYLPSLLLLDKVIGNELNHLRAQDDLAFERAQNKKGGIFKLLKKTEISGDYGTLSAMSGESGTVVNPKKVSHPRLLTLHSPHSKMITPIPGKIPHEPTLYDIKIHHPHLKMVPPIPGRIPHEKTMYKDELRLHHHWQSQGDNKSLHIIPESDRGRNTTMILNCLIVRQADPDQTAPRGAV